MNSWVKLFFLAYLLLGLWIVSDYGISMDEPIQRKHGMVAFEYVNNLFDLYASAPQVTGENLSNYDHRDYGMFFQFVAYSLELSLGIDNSKDVFLLRHLMVFLLFWVGLILFFLALKSRFQNQTLALLGILCIILSPRIFGDSFYNPKDIPLLSWFMIGIYSFVRFVKNPSLNNIIIHALVASLCIGSRIVGILIPVIFGFWLLSNYFYLDKEYKLKHILIQLTVYFTFLILFTFSLWPVLWENPITSFLYSFQSMSQFRWSGSMLYMGELIHSSSIPWHYAPVWIAVTSPIAILVLFLSGIFSTVFEIKVKGAAFLSERNNRIDLAITLLFFGPLLAVILFNSVLYNGWRHLYFIYPAMIWISIRGLKSLWQYSSNSKKSKWITYVIIVLGVINATEVVYFMIKYHPHQSVYFNQLAGNVEKNFERDYYGVSYKKALTLLLSQENGDTLKIFSLDFIGRINRMNFTKADADRLYFVENIEEADYFITLYYFRSDLEYQKFTKKTFPYNMPKVVEIDVSDYPIIGIYKLR